MVWRHKHGGHRAIWRKGGKYAAAEHAALQEQNRLLQTEVIALRQQAHYHRTQHQRAVQRAQELEAQVGVLKRRWPASSSDSLVVRVSEQAERALRAQLGRKAASVLEPRVSNPAAPVTAASSGRILRWWRLCWISASNKSAVRAAARRGKASVPPHTQRTDRMGSAPLSTPNHSAQVSSSPGCHCQPQRPDIISAPLAPALIPKGMLATQFPQRSLVAEVSYHVPLERIRAMVRSAGLELSAGTLCGALEKLTPLFDPLYEAIQAQSRQAALCLMDETRWEVFVEEPNKGSHRWWALGRRYAPDSTLYCRPVTLRSRAQSLFWLRAGGGSLPL